MARIQIDTTEAKVCRKCGKGGLISRHHMGFDSYTGLYNGVIRRQYELFLDCVDLCDSCHMEIHWIYNPYVDIWYRYHLKVPSPKAALELRLELITICHQWLNGQIKPMPIPERFVSSWKRTKQTHPSSALPQSTKGSDHTKGK